MSRKVCKVGLSILLLVSCASLAAATVDTKLADAAMRADRSAVRSLLDHKVDVNAAQADGMTALHWAARLNDVETAEMLIRAGANPNLATRYGITPMYFACQNGSADMIGLLLRAGVDSNSANPNAADRGRVDAYLDDIREIERRIKTVLDREAAGGTQNVPEAPVGTPEAFEDHIKLMFDLLALAYQSETTRVATLMYAKDLSPASYPASGNRNGFHGASHHANIKANMDAFALINKYHVQVFTYFVDKLANTADGDGSLLDHSMILYGSSMSNGNQHDHDPLPIVLVGGASGRFTGNRHIVTPPHTPMSNLLLGMLDKLGVERDSFGDSAGKLEL